MRAFAFCTVMLSVLALGTGADGAIVTPVVDPDGDTSPGTPDIVLMEAEVVGGNAIKFTITFKEPVSAPSDFLSTDPFLVGFLAIDLYTGVGGDIPAALAALAAAGGGLLSPLPGDVDFVIDLFSEAFGELDVVYDDSIAGLQVAGTAVASYGQQFEITIPLAFLNTDAAALATNQLNLAFGAIVGDFTFPADIAPQVAAVPEPASLVAWSLCSVGAGLLARRRFKSKTKAAA